MARTTPGEIPHAIEPAIALAIRHECEQAVAPVLTEVRAINERLGRGDTSLALLNQRVDVLEDQPKTDRHERRREMHPVMLAGLTAAVTIVVNLTVLWWLGGIGAAAAKAGAQ